MTHSDLGVSQQMTNSVKNEDKNYAESDLLFLTQEDGASEYEFNFIPDNDELLP